MHIWFSTPDTYSSVPKRWYFLVVESFLRCICLVNNIPSFSSLYLFIEWNPSRKRRGGFLVQRCVFYDKEDTRNLKCHAECLSLYGLSTCFFYAVISVMILTEIIKLWSCRWNRNEYRACSHFTTMHIKLCVSGWNYWNFVFIFVLKICIDNRFFLSAVAVVFET